MTTTPQVTDAMERAGVKAALDAGNVISRTDAYAIYTAMSQARLTGVGNEWSGKCCSSCGAAPWDWTDPPIARPTDEADVERLRRKRVRSDTLGRETIYHVNPDGPEAASLIEAQQAEIERLTAMASRVKAAIELAEPVSDEMLASARGRFSLRETAARFGVGVGRVRGAWQRAALKEGTGQ